MARTKTDKERALIINRIIELVKEQGRITTNDVVAMFGLHRTTAEKYLHVAVEQGGPVRHGRCGVFRDQRATIDFDLKRFSHSKVAAGKTSPNVLTALTAAISEPVASKK